MSIKGKICDYCQFILHCGCVEDDHEYKLEVCQLYALDDENERLRQQCRWVPSAGETVYIIANDCDNCPYGEDGYKYCDSCELYSVVTESFSPAEHLDGWYAGEVWRTPEEAEKVLKECEKK